MGPGLHRVTRAVGVLGLATASMVAAHCGGYQLAAWRAAAVADATSGGWLPQRHAHSPGPVDVHAGHGHMLPMASVGFLMAVVGLLATFVLLRRRRARSLPPVGVLLGLQLVGFVAMEAMERLPGGIDWGQTLQDRRVLFGLLLQPAVAMLVHRACRRTLEVVAQLFAPPAKRATPGSPVTGWAWPASASARRRVLLTGTSPRGPPGWTRLSTI